MKFFRIADLHLGRTLYQHSLLEDQKHYLDFILDQIDQEKPDLVLIAGDVYDRIYLLPQGDLKQLLSSDAKTLKQIFCKIFNTNLIVDF